MRNPIKTSQKGKLSYFLSSFFTFPSNFFLPFPFRMEQNPNENLMSDVDCRLCHRFKYLLQAQQFLHSFDKREQNANA